MEPTEPEETISKILGFGLDANDGHIRITEGEDFKLLLGSENTHEEMRDLLEKIQGEAHKKGKEIHDLSRGEFIDIAKELKSSTRR
jgi:hypothetical protein